MSKDEFSINVEVVEVHNVKGSTARNYLTAVRDGKKLSHCGRTYNTNIIASIGDKLEVVFVELSKYIDPDTKEIWYNFWSPRVLKKSNLTDNVATAEKLVKQSGGQIQSKSFPTRYKDELEEDEYIKNFESNALLWDTEEFDFALDQGWIKNEVLIPEQLSIEGCSEIRNTNEFIIKKTSQNRAIVCLRNKLDKIEAEKFINLVEVNDGN